MTVQYSMYSQITVLCTICQRLYYMYYVRTNDCTNYYVPTTVPHTHVNVLHVDFEKITQLSYTNNFKIPSQTISPVRLGPLTTDNDVTRLNNIMYGRLKTGGGRTNELKCR